MIEAVLIAVAAAIALFYVLSPARSGPRADLPRSSERAEDALERKRAAFTALLDIEQEHEIGKLSETDLAALRVEYETEALRALEELESVEHGSGDAIEAEIARFRAQICTNCGARRSPGERCDRCGAS